MSASVLTEITDNYTGPKGFSFGDSHCGIKRTRPDLATITCEPAATAAGCFTQNPVRAPCVDRNASLVPATQVHGVLVNSGNANAMTGESGIVANREMAEHLAAALQCEPTQILTLSTGVIGVPLNTRVIGKATPNLVKGAGPSPLGFAEAILTTDTCTKVAYLDVQLPGENTPIKLLGIAKGSGMIHPNMATTLAFVCTDAKVAPEQLQQLLSGSIGATFNAITVDGDTSTNDTTLVLANGASRQTIEGDARVAAFGAALHAVLLSLAKQVAQDGEGATRLLEVDVSGAADLNTATAVARGICRSSLFKCSVFAGQADWGRLAAAAGQAALEAGLELTGPQLNISVQGIDLVKSGQPVDTHKSSELQRKLREPVVNWTVTIGNGPGTFTAYGCDLSYDYVRINADEATQVEVSPGGMVARNLTLSAYSPRLKHQLLVDGLAYVRRFTGLKALVYVHGVAAERLDLTASLAEDVELCVDAGLKPLVVVPHHQMADALLDHIKKTGHYATKVAPDPAEISLYLDRGHLCVVVESVPEPGEFIDLAIKLGVQKFIALGDGQGLEDHAGLVSVLSPELLLAGLDRQRFHTGHPEFLALARQGAVRGVPALHLIDGRIPHALVGELFTDQGIGTLITRQSVN